MAEVRFSVEALASLRSHLAHLAERNPQAAGALAADVARCTDFLADFPGAGRRIDGTPLRCRLTRRYRYRIFYVEMGDEVEVIDILHPRQSGPF